MAYSIQQELCSCCHRCRVECPAEAIRIKDSKYWIDPSRCISCGHCAEVCHNDVITSDREPPAIQPHATLTKTCDVLVIGAGASGLAAAARAAAMGRKVLVLEKNKEIGGSAWYAHVLRLHWSKWHEAAGFPDRRDDLHREFMEKTQGQVNSKLVRAILDADADFINWLIDEHDLGKDFSFGPLPFGGFGIIGKYDWDYNHQRIDNTIGPGGTGWYMVNKLLAILTASGGEILYRTSADQLILDDSGAVTRVLASDAGGRIEIGCKSCIIATGAFSRNPDLVRKFQPAFFGSENDEDVHILTCSTCTGDGIVMCQAIDADIDYVNARVGMFGPMRHPFGIASIAAYHNPYGVTIDKTGEIYVQPREHLVVSKMADSPGRLLWYVLDERGVERAESEATGRQPDVVGIDTDRIFRNWREELAKEIEWETIFRSDTLLELAEKISVPYHKLTAAVAQFNADNEKPQAIGPSGPFYALKLKMFHENAIGGIVNDENMQVLRAGRPIPGLYAAGDTTRGEMVPGEVGMMYVEATISALTFALCSGYVAGGKAAATMLPESRPQRSD